MCKTVEVHEIKIDEWAKLVNESPVSSWFQTQEAYSFFDSISFLKAFAIGVESDSNLKGVIVGYIQQDGNFAKRYFSRRAIVNGGPLLAQDIKEEELSMLLTVLKNKLKSEAIYIEIRNYCDYSQWKKEKKKNGFSYQPHYDVHIDTPNLESVNGGLNRNRKRNIKKALENGLTIDDHPGEKELSIFYQQLQKLYQDKVKTPLYPYEFFQKLWNLPSSRFFVAKEEKGRVIGGMMCIALKGKVLYAWFACGEDDDYKNLSPSVMVNYASICHAAENAFHTFDFMGAGKPDDGGYGVRDFKLKFGGKLLELGRYDYICNPALYSLGKTVISLLKKMK